MPTKCVYKPDQLIHSTDEYIVIIQDPAAAQKWINGDKTIPLVDIVDSFDVFHSGQGSQGYLQRPSQQELETIFGTHNDAEIVEIVLSKGKLQTSDAPFKLTGSAKNTSQSGSFQTSRGATMGGR